MEHANSWRSGDGESSSYRIRSRRLERERRPPVSPRRLLSAASRGLLPRAGDAQQGSEMPAPRGLRRRLGRWASRSLIALTMRLPLPSEVKWQCTLDFIRDLTIEYYRDLARTLPEPEARRVVMHALSASGRRWMHDLATKQGTDLNSGLALADILKVVFRTLNIDSSVEPGRGEVLVTNYACPYLAQATEQGMPAGPVCEMMCGDVNSLLEGVTHGLPAMVLYRSHAMMGLGAQVCVKRFSGPLARRAP